ncbi:MAG: DUF4160 domain-containing protein [Prochlorococcaceae cyanobacterium]
MSPTIFQEGEFRVFFFSREESRPHVHVSDPDGEADFWLSPTVELARNIGLIFKDQRSRAPGQDTPTGDHRCLEQPL